MALCQVDLVVACLGPLACIDFRSVRTLGPLTLRLAYPDERKAAELVAELAGA